MNSVAPEIYTHTINSPIGELSLAIQKRGGIFGIRFGHHTEWPNVSRAESNKYACGELALELDEYFAGKRQRFDLPLSLRGSDFQLEVWKILSEVPWGSVISYGELARKTGSPGAARAVAGAVATNPLPIIIPCHRVILQSGAPGQYATHFVSPRHGQTMKRTLLELEGIKLRWPEPELIPLPEY